MVASTSRSVSPGGMGGVGVDLSSTPTRAPMISTKECHTVSTSGASLKRGDGVP